MSENRAAGVRNALVKLKPFLPAVAALLAVYALWLVWSGWQHLQNDSRRSGITLARDMAVESTTGVLRNDLGRLSERLDSDAMRVAMRDGDFAAAAAVLKQDWVQLEHAEVVPADLVEVYAGLGEGGFGRAAALEAARIGDAPVVWVVRDGDQPRLALAAPVKVDEALVGIAYVGLPLARLDDAMGSPIVDPAAYLALRHGGYTVIERGDRSLFDAAERMALPVPGSGLRMVAASPPVGSTPFGLTGIPLFGLAMLLLLVAYLVWRWLPTRLTAVAVQVSADEPVQTLAEVLEAEPLPEAAVPALAQDPARPPPVSVDRGIFRAYDIRGVVGQSLDVGVAEAIGQAIGSLMREQDLSDIVIGRDGRLSGEDMVAGLVAGLRKAGRNVIDIGMVPTPVTYFGAYHLRTGCCVSVTGSHNPPDYNGFKIVVGGETLSGDAITDLYDRIVEGQLHIAPSLGDVNQRDISEDYIDRIASDVQLARPLKVVVDAGNGVAGEIGPRVLEAIGAEVVQLFCEIDGTFPNHHPDPSEPHNLADLISTVARFEAELGVAFDGDGDRLGVVTADGHNIFPDRLLMLFAADVLERNPGAVIVYDVKCTGHLPGYILRHGGSPLMWKTGHSLIKAKMRETEAELAGEMSGHFFFSERWYGFDDGIYAAARLLEVLALADESPSEVLHALPAGVSTPEIKVAAPGGDPHDFVERFRAAATFEGARLSSIDGLRADWPDGWGLVRASNTTPVLVLRFDADNEEALARIQQAFRAQLLMVDPELELAF